MTRTVLAALTVLPLAAQLTVPNGTKLNVRLEQTISSATADEGQPVQLSVTESVKVNDIVVIQQGSTVVGTIVNAEAKRRMGRTGKLDFSIDKVRAVDGDFIPLRYSIQKKQGGSTAVSTGVMTAGAAIVFWPAAPFFLLRKGKDITIQKGIVFDVFTDQDHVTKAQGGPPPAGATPIPGGAGGMATITITSNINGAEIELDGNFVGSTPTTRQVTAGAHKIAVKTASDSWQRSMDVQAGSNVTVNAPLKK